MKNYNIETKYIFLFFVFFLLLITNSFHNYDESIILGGADGYSYFEISKYSPSKSEVPIQPIHAERFIIPYIIGLFSKTLNIEILFFYRIAVIFLIFFIALKTQNFLNKNNFDNKIIFTALCLIIFYPYLTIFYISNPLIINDLFFMYGSLISIDGLD